MSIKRKQETIRISLTDFIDFVSRAGSPKLTKVRQIKARDVYHPATDFYKLLREHIIKTHQKELGKNDLEIILKTLTDEKKKKNYPAAISGYKQFWGKKNFRWFIPPHKNWKVGDVELKVNPELGLECGDEFLVIKLYLKSENLAKDRVTQILTLMEAQLRRKVEPEIVFCVLDVKNGKLFRNDSKDSSLLPLLEGEIRSFESIWKSI